MIAGLCSRILRMQDDEVTGAAVAQIVPVHRCHHHVGQSHRRDGAAQIFRFVLIQRQRLAVGNVAERAAPGADVAHDHECGGAVAEAFADIRAGGFLADRMQPVLAQHAFEPQHLRVGRAIWRESKRVCVAA